MNPVYPEREKISVEELNIRMDRFRTIRDKYLPDGKLVAIFNPINQYYFTGTLQEGVLLIPSDTEPCFYVRSNYRRACDESSFPLIKPMRSFRDIAADYTPTADSVSSVYIETGSTSYQKVQMFSKYFPGLRIQSVDRVMAVCRAVKTSYEISLLEQAGELHRTVLEERLPGLLEEGMSEADLCTKLFSEMMRIGHHSVMRFNMLDIEMNMGTVAFGENTLYPTMFDGPGGSRGMHPSSPFYGSRDRFLKPGDLVFVDIGFGKNGYHTDKTLTYVYKGKLSDEAVRAHNRCREIEALTASLLRPGAIPSEIYRRVIDGLEPEFKENFMGFGDRCVSFLGHGTGLHIDEYPVIAEKFDEPLEENMVIALEPKKGIAGVGMVGVENTFIVTPEGGRKITGDHPGLMPVGN